MPTTPKILAEGQVTAAKATAYTVPASTQAIIRTVSLCQVAGASQTVSVYVKKSGSASRVFSRAVLAANEFAHEDEIGTLAAGDQIELQTTDDATVDFTIMGVEVTA